MKDVSRVRPSFCAALLYLALGSAWIVFSDRFVYSMAPDAEQLTRLQNLKGWAYVLLTTLLVYLLVEAVDRQGRRLRVLDRRFKVAFEAMPVGLAVVDQDGRIGAVNSAFVRLFGRSPRDWQGQPAPEVLWAPDRPPRFGETRVIELRGRIELGELRSENLPASGDVHQGSIWLEMRRLALDAESRADGAASEGRGSLLLVEDITSARRAETEQRLAAVAFEARQPILVTSAEGTILRVNRAYAALAGYTAEELIGRNPRLLKSGRQGESFYRRMWRQLIEQDHWEGELWNRDRKGREFPQWQSISTVRDDDGDIAYFVAHITDLSERREVEARLDALEHTDLLTGLPNRRRLLQRLGDAFPEPNGALMLVDVDDFHLVNEGLGVEGGDAVLRAMAGMLRELANPDEQMLARVSADIFAIAFLPSSGASRDALLQSVGAFADRVHARIRLLQVVPGAEAALTVSIGVHVMVDDDAGPATVLNHAELALTRAKQAGPGSFALFEQGMQADAESRLHLAAALRLALEREEIHANFQPKCRAGGEVVGAEALARWHPPGGEPVSPAVFVPMIEALRLEADLGRLMRGHALALAKRLHEGGSTIPVSVNLTVRELHDADLPERIRAELAAHDLPPAALILEVTESQLIQDFSAIGGVLNRLRAAGIQMSIDDFGTGFSSLSYLNRMPVDELKIDGSFVAAAARSKRDESLLRAILELGRALGLSVVAEGVETPEQAALLSSLGCELMQGWHFSRPLDAEAFIARVAQRR